MAKKQTGLSQTLRHILLRISRVHFLYVAAYILTVVMFDAWNLISHEAVIQRWTAGGALLVIVTIVWYLCKSRLQSEVYYKGLVVILLICDILFAATNVYWERGMAAKAVLLFLVPIISAGLVRSRSLLLAITSLSTAAYSIAAVRYFYANYGQGYRVELYGEIFFYSAMFFVVAGLLLIGFRSAKD